jgi:ATP-dependent protease Clp ATPase subunit
LNPNLSALACAGVFERLTEKDLCDILKNPNNPIILGKKLDFAAYGIDVKFQTEALDACWRRAHDENTGARGLVSAVEERPAAIRKTLPSTPSAACHHPKIIEQPRRHNGGPPRPARGRYLQAGL